MSKNNLTEFNNIVNGISNIEKNQEKKNMRNNRIKRFTNRFENAKDTTESVISNAASQAKNLASRGLEKSGNAIKFTASKMSSMAQSLSNKLNNSVISNVIQGSIGVLVVALIAVLVFLSKKMNSKLKLAIHYLIYSLVTIFAAGYGIFMLLGNNNLSQIISVALTVGASLLFVVFVKNLIVYFKSLKTDSPYLVKTTLNGNSSIVIPQDPENPNTVIIYPSDNEQGGLEFSYVFWIYIDDSTYRNVNVDEFHVLHKGSEEVENNVMAPGIFLDSKTNTLIVKMNTIAGKKPYEKMKIKNIPINKWVHVALTVQQQDVMIFINGRLKEKHELKSIPRQNYGDVYLNLNGGFDGFLSKVQYFRRELDPLEIMNIVQKGPSKDSCVSTGETPPYLADDWWLQ